MAEAGVRFLYIPASDLDAMRHFYTEVLGLDEIWFQPEEGVAYESGGLQFSIFLDPGVPSGADAWATQPGWSGDTVSAISWSVVLSGPAYNRAVEILGRSDTPRLHDRPQWRGYWSFPVRDPMGNTVELSWPEQTPSSTVWSE